MNFSMLLPHTKRPRFIVRQFDSQRHAVLARGAVGMNQANVVLLINPEVG